MEVQDGKQAESDPTGEGDSQTPRVHHLACVICRKRKLRCDGQRPTCSTCVRTKQTCEYVEVRRKTGPRKGYVKSLAARLAEIESLLEQREESDANATNDTQSRSLTNSDETGMLIDDPISGIKETWDNSRSWETPNLPPGTSIHPIDNEWVLPDPTQASVQFPHEEIQNSFEEPPYPSANVSDSHGYGPWSLHTMGVEEPLPSQEAIDELHEIFFERIQRNIPIMHRGRYLSAMSLPPTSRLRPPVCLSYAIWTLAAHASPKYASVTDHFYSRARKYAEVDELHGYGQRVLTLAHVQTCVFLSSYELLVMYFPRAWLTLGKGVRLCQMMGLHKVDGVGLDTRQGLPAPVDWTELEERRRTFWAMFVQDRYFSIGTGWPMNIDESDVATSLPASEEAFVSSQLSPTMTLKEALTPAGAKRLTTFAGGIVIASLFGQTLNHLHRKDPDEVDSGDLQNPFWKRHRKMDNILLNTIQYLPAHLSLRSGLTDPNVVQLHLHIHACTICLHQTAVFKASSVSQLKDLRIESFMRCASAVGSIMTILRLIPPDTISKMGGGFLSFDLYVAARALVSFLKSPESGPHKTPEHMESLKFLVKLLHEQKINTPYTKSLILQLQLDLESLDDLNPAGHVRVSTVNLRDPNEIKHSLLVPEQKPTVPDILSNPTPLSSAQSHPVLLATSLPRQNPPQASHQPRHHHAESASWSQARLQTHDNDRYPSRHEQQQQQQQPQQTFHNLHRNNSDPSNTPEVPSLLNLSDLNQRARGQSSSSSSLSAVNLEPPYAGNNTSVNGGPGSRMEQRSVSDFGAGFQPGVYSSESASRHKQGHHHMPSADGRRYEGYSG